MSAVFAMSILLIAPNIGNLLLIRVLLHVNVLVNNEGGNYLLRILFVTLWTATEKFLFFIGVHRKNQKFTKLTNLFITFHEFDFAPL
jgi:hypothetical protein